MYVCGSGALSECPFHCKLPSCIYMSSFPLDINVTDLKHSKIKC